jgi:hypothetical protein
MNSNSPHRGRLLGIDGERRGKETERKSAHERPPVHD